MARTRKKLAKRPSRRRTARGSTSLTSPETAAQQLTQEILALDRGNKSRIVGDVVAIGERLERLQQNLGHGRWLSWINAHLPYSHRTTQRYIAVARWAAENPEDHEHFAPLGLGKLQLIASLNPQQRARFRRQQRFKIPGTNTRKTLALMTLEQFHLVLLGPAALTAQPPALPPGRVLQQFRRRLARLDALTEDLRSHAEELDPEDIEEAAEGLERLVEEVRSMLPE